LPLTRVSGLSPPLPPLSQAREGESEGKASAASRQTK
jgi:hypothetical protein